MSDLTTVLAETRLTMAELARKVGTSRSHLCHVKAGRKGVSPGLAIAIWRETKRKIGPIANSSDADIRALARFHEAA